MVKVTIRIGLYAGSRAEIKQVCIEGELDEFLITGPRDQSPKPSSRRSVRRYMNLRVCYDR